MPKKLCTISVQHFNQFNQDGTLYIFLYTGYPAGGVRMTTAMDFGWVFFKMAKKLTRIVELLPSMYYDMTGKYFYFQWFCITRLLK